jgi:hypothetical protein
VKALLSTWHFGYPFFLTCCHSVFATIMTQLIYFFYPDWYVPLCSSVQLLFSSSLHRLPGVKSSQISVTMFFTKIVPIALFFSVSRRQRSTYAGLMLMIMFFWVLLGRARVRQLRIQVHFRCLPADHEVHDASADAAGVVPHRSRETHLGSTPHCGGFNECAVRVLGQ